MYIGLMCTIQCPVPISSCEKSLSAREGGASSIDMDGLPPGSASVDGGWSGLIVRCVEAGLAIVHYNQLRVCTIRHVGGHASGVAVAMATATRQFHYCAPPHGIDR